jgi:enoyl-CoA hydratase
MEERKDRSMKYECIISEKIGPVARLWHNRPQVRNAENSQILDELMSALAEADADNEIRVIVFAGKGGHFSAGHDMKEGRALRSDLTLEKRWAYEEKYYLGYCLNILNSEKPTIAQVEGACLSGGFMVANMCDLMIASEDAFFGDPVVHTQALACVEVLIHPWVLGARKAKEMLFAGQRLSAADAHAAGMVNRVVPAAKLEETVLELANRIAQAPPFALKVLKKSINRTFDIMGRESALRAHFDSHLATHYSPEAVALRSTGENETIRRDAKGRSVNLWTPSS